MQATASINREAIMEFHPVDQVTECETCGEAIESRVVKESGIGTYVCVAGHVHNVSETDSYGRRTPATLTFTYTVELSDDEAAAIRADQDVASDGTVTARTYGYGVLGQIVSRHGLPAVYRNVDTGEHHTRQGNRWGRAYPRLSASIVLTGGE